MNIVIPGAFVSIWKWWLAFLTRIGLRQHKGLRDVPPDASPAHPTDETLDSAIAGMKKISPEEIATNPAFRGAPKKLEKGERYDARSGATIYADSEVMTPYIGSEREEADFRATHGRPLRAPKVSGVTCPSCLGWGFRSSSAKCESCKGKGSI